MPFVWRVLLVVMGCAVLAPHVWALDLDVEIHGVDGELKRNVEAFLQIYQERKTPEMQIARLRRLHNRAPEQIRRALQPFGYYRVEVAAELTREDANRSAWVAAYRIDPGEQAVVTSIDFTLEGEAADDVDFPQVFGLTDGMPLVHAKWESAKNELLFTAAAQGYLDARLEQSRVVVDTDRNTASVEVRFRSGPRYYFGPVRFRQDLFYPEYLQRFVELEQGEPYNQDAVLRLQGDLLRTDYFRRVEMVPVTEEADPETRAIPLEVHVTPSKRDRYRVGIGFATDIGPTLTLDWTRRWINRSGHRANAELIVAPRYQEVSGEYWIPLKRPATEHLRIRPEYHRLKTASRKEEVASLDVAHSVLWRGWRRNLGVEFRYEDYDVADEREDVNELVPYIDVSRTVSDNPLFTSRGYRLKFALLGTLGYLGSTADYISTTASAKWIRAFGADYRFLTRADLGVTWADSILDVPGSRRFFAGGDQSIRGYEFEELGPTDPESGEVVGGRYLAVGSLELERRVKGDWSAAVFYDFGNAFDPDYENKYAQSVGVGARWRSPIGQVRVDLGVGIESDDTPLRLHLVIGPDL